MHRFQIQTRWGIAALAVAAFAQTASAQGFDNQWVTFAPAASNGDFATTSNTNTEVDFAWADLDADGWIDLVSVRKQQFTSAGKRTNELYMNNGGELIESAALFATDSDIPGDNGFLTPTNDRDVFISDVNLDGWLDIITAVTLSDNDPKHIGHPRVYMNQGETAGTWNGFRHEDARIPQFFSFNNGNPYNPRHCSVAAGDLTGDGYPDLYWGDYDSSGAGGVGQPGALDLNDRLGVNDGNGFFADESQSRMTSNILLSAFGMASEIADMNGDGANDVVKDTALNPPQYIAIAYNDVNNVGQFTDARFDVIHNFAPYHVEVGDLNNDGRLDFISSDDNSDRFRINQGNDVFGRVIWSGATTYSFLKGGDDGFGSNALIVDIDGDGWAEAIHCDVDVDIPNGSSDPNSTSARYMHIYHNVTNPATPNNVVLREERTNANNGVGTWRGVTGMQRTDATLTHDVAVFDRDNDGDMDIMIARVNGGQIWDNQTNTPEFCQTDLGFGGPGTTVLTVCGDAPLTTGNTATVLVDSPQPFSIGYLAVGAFNNPVPLFGGTVVPVPTSTVITFSTDANGDWSAPTTAPAVTATRYVQAAVIDITLPDLVQLSNAVAVQYN
jgi:hypothetical protein